MAEQKLNDELQEVILKVVREHPGCLPIGVLGDESLREYPRRQARDVMQEMIEEGTLKVNDQRALKV